MKTVDPVRRSLLLAATTALLLALPTFGVASDSPSLAQSLDRPKEPGYISHHTCVLGNTLELEAQGVRKVSVDDNSVLEVQASDDRQTLFISCTRRGTSILTVYLKDASRAVAVEVIPSAEAQ